MLRGKDKELIELSNEFNYHLLYVENAKKEFYKKKIQKIIEKHRICKNYYKN